MAITSFEESESRKFTDGRNGKRSFIIRGTADQDAATTELKSIADSSFFGLSRNKVTVEPIMTDENASGGVWRGTAEYLAVVRPLPEASGDSFFNFDTGGGTQHITQSNGTVASFVSTGAAPTGNGAINAVPGGSVEGVDIVVPIYNFSETHIFALETVTTAYKGILYDLTGKINDAAFKGTNAGECLFMGASGQSKGEDQYEIAFNFAALPNKTNFAVGDITGVNKRGWEYLWVVYGDAVDEDTLIKTPKSVHVERVYDEGDFSTLTIGV